MADPNALFETQAEEVEAPKSPPKQPPPPQPSPPPKQSAAKRANAVSKPVAKKPSATKKPPAKTAPSKPPSKAGPTPGGPKRTFPSVTLQEALKVPRAVRVKNGGNPMPTELVAVACDSTPKGEKFFYLTSASQNYGLTIGSRTSPQIELTPLGRAIVYATSPVEEEEKKIEAFFTVEKFKQVFDYYNGSSTLPEKQYLSNALENQFQLPPDQHDEFTEVFKANCAFLNIEDGLKNRRSRAENGDTGTAPIDVRSMGKPKGEFERTAFVIMPFSEKGKQERAKGYFDEVLKNVITPAANAAGFAVETARQEDSDIIHHTIINRLLRDDLVIADLTDHNPNVLFELGIRLAKEKPVVIIKSKDTGPIFDVDNMLRVYIYDQNLWKSTVDADVKALTERITGTWSNNETTVGYMRILTTSPHAVK